MLDSNSFKVTVKLAEGFTSVTPEPEVQLAFQGVGSHSLTPWVVKPGQRFHYKLPALVDPDEVEVSLGVDRQGSQLANCDCYEYLHKHNSGTQTRWMTGLVAMTVFAATTI